MLFNSIDFAIFLPIVFLLYWYVFDKNLKKQNTLLLVSSFIFYGWWDWRFLSLILFSSILDYCVGIGLSKTENSTKRKILLLISVVVNIGFLALFKYFNFFAESLVQAFTFFGQSLNITRLNVILPVGISFYTFQTMSYSIDVYNKKMNATYDLVEFLAFVSFFPQLVAGPIERAINLLPQFYQKRTFDYSKAIDGMRQILWGLFKKIVVADNCAKTVNFIFLNCTDYSGSTLFLGAVLFAFQIYCDFSGYSDIAIGTARLFGFTLMRNFSFPYFSRDIAEFWRRWHISLSTWFRDYVYFPLGGSRGNIWNQVRNVFIIFTVSGFWHGANWTFIVWGALNAVYFLPLLLLSKNRVHTDIVAEKRMLPTIKEALQMATTFFMTTIAWIFFRAESISQAFSYTQSVFSWSFFSFPEVFPQRTLFFILILLAAEWIQREKQHALQFDTIEIPKIVRWGLYYATVSVIILFGGVQQSFIYFQF